ncbi:MAG: SagB/ThcOx family dehydrogenase [Planctomycetaceae bacterium]|jgi:nitroreductase|nr:SagB/ThcOx family dehydrogenase [Planctomycetaceae bacterium]
MKTLFLTAAILFVSACVTAQDVKLPTPQTTGGKPLFDAFRSRQSDRNISDANLDLQTISEVLWSAYGFNRNDKRVIPTANNKQEIEVYAVLKDGIYLYDAKNNALILKASGDHRKIAGAQPFVHIAPLNIIYVADFSKGTTLLQSSVACGAASQNVYLASASKGLGCVVRTTINSEELHKVLKLTADQQVLLGQTVGKTK